MIEIIPSILVNTKEEFESKLQLIHENCDTIHIDMLDGSLFSETSWFDPAEIAKMKSNASFELHLMIENPLPVVKKFKNNNTKVNRAIVHAEIDRQIGTVIGQIRDKHKLEAGIALNPETPLHEIREHADQISQLTLMSVHPGKSGQKFLGESIFEKIKTAHELYPNLSLEIDGGVTEELIGPLVKSGITRICAASLIFQSDNPQAKLKELKKRAKLL